MHSAFNNVPIPIHIRWKAAYVIRMFLCQVQFFPQEAHLNIVICSSNFELHLGETGGRRENLGLYALAHAAAAALVVGTRRGEERKFYWS